MLMERSMMVSGSMVRSMEMATTVTQMVPGMIYNKSITPQLSI